MPPAIATVRAICESEAVERRRAPAANGDQRRDRHRDPDGSADPEHHPPQVRDTRRLDSCRMENRLDVGHYRCPVWMGTCADRRDSGNPAIRSSFRPGAAVIGTWPDIDCT